MVSSQVVKQRQSVPMDSRIRARRVKVIRDQGRRRLKLLSAGASPVVVVVGALVLLHSGLFSIRNLRISGNLHESASAIAQRAGVQVGKTPLIDVDGASASRRIDSMPWVASASVVRHWPWSLTITVTERIPVATVSGSHGAVLVVDASGRILGTKATSAPSLPSLAGVSTSRSAGQHLPSSVTSSLKVAASIPVSLEASVSSIQSAASGGVDLVMPTGAQVVMGRPVDLGAKWEALATLLARGATQGAKSIDLEVPQLPTVSP